MLAVSGAPHAFASTPSLRLASWAQDILSPGQNGVGCRTPGRAVSLSTAHTLLALPVLAPTISHHRPIRSPPSQSPGTHPAAALVASPTSTKHITHTTPAPYVHTGGSRSRPGRPAAGQEVFRMLGRIAMLRCAWRVMLLVGTWRRRYSNNNIEPEMNTEILEHKCGGRWCTCLNGRIVQVLNSLHHFPCSPCVI